MRKFLFPVYLERVVSNETMALTTGCYLPTLASFHAKASISNAQQINHCTSRSKTIAKNPSKSNVPKSLILWLKVKVQKREVLLNEGKNWSDNHKNETRII